VTESEKPQANAVGCGALFLLAGLLLTGGLVWGGVALLGADETRMGHLHHVAGTVVVGPFAVLLVAAGLRLLRRRRWD
jgi:hypothetical protein